VFDAFRSDTGISVGFRGERNQDDMFRAAQGGGFDIACPTTDRLASWHGAGLISPLDEDRAGCGGIDPAFRADSQTLIGGQRFGSPCLWGGAGIGHHASLVPGAADCCSLMDLFDPQYAGRLAMREDTAMVAAGRALCAAGQLPYPFADSYRREDRMKANYDVISAFLIERRHHVARFWFSEEEGIEGFASGACVIGYNWDTTLAALQRSGLPYRFTSPVEGAACYLQNFVLSSSAVDPGPGLEWISWVNTPEGGARYAAAFGANAAAAGAARLMSREDREFFTRSYPPEALASLWWQPEQPVWFVRNREEYARRYRADAAA
jgi:spermidine/putrescine transport system substrate-binding protein